MDAETKRKMAKHRKAVNALYKSKGIGRTAAQRLKYWESQHPGGYSISHVPEDPKKAVLFKVAIFEDIWATMEFPEDFSFH